MSKKNDQHDDDWYVVDLDERPPVRKVEPIAIERDWIRLGRHHRVRIGYLAVKGKDAAIRKAKANARQAIALASMNLERAKQVAKEIEA